MRSVVFQIVFEVIRAEGRQDEGCISTCGAAPRRPPVNHDIGSRGRRVGQNYIDVGNFLSCEYVSM